MSETPSGKPDGTLEEIKEFIKSLQDDKTNRMEKEIQRLNNRLSLVSDTRAQDHIDLKEFNANFERMLPNQFKQYLEDIQKRYNEYHEEIAPLNILGGGLDVDSNRVEFINELKARDIREGEGYDEFVVLDRIEKINSDFGENKNSLLHARYDAPIVQERFSHLKKPQWVLEWEKETGKKWEQVHPERPNRDSDMNTVEGANHRRERKIEDALRENSVSIDKEDTED